jgi:hypothetical protein
MAVYCEPCKERRATESPAKHFPGGTPMCDSCFGGRITKAKEEIMPKKIEIDGEKLKALHAQGLCDREIGERFGCSAVTIGTARNKLGLPKGRPGRRPSGNSGNLAAKRSEIASAGGNFQRRPESPIAGPDRSGPSESRNRTRVSSRESRETATLHLSAAALDRLWEALSLEMKVDCINKILAN